MTLDDQDQTRLALGAFFVALARTLGEQDKSFPQRFDENLQRLYRDFGDNENPPLPAMESLRWAHEMIDQ